jgi:hypothetical protein
VMDMGMLLLAIGGVVVVTIVLVALLMDRS